MSVFVSEDCLVRNYHKNKKYFINETKRERDARIKRAHYKNNRDVFRLKASKRYYENKLNTITDNTQKQITINKIEELEKQLMEAIENSPKNH